MHPSAFLVSMNDGLDFSQDVVAANKAVVWGEWNLEHGRGWIDGMVMIWRIMFTWNIRLKVLSKLSLWRKCYLTKNTETWSCRAFPSLEHLQQLVLNVTDFQGIQVQDFQWY
jgi:hypothetical protein